MSQRTASQTREQYARCEEIVKEFSDWCRATLKTWQHLDQEIAIASAQSFSFRLTRPAPELKTPLKVKKRRVKKSPQSTS